MSEKCKEEVYDNISRRFFGCSRNAVKDGFCKQHHPHEVQARKTKSMNDYVAKLANNPYNLAIKRAEKAEHQRDALLAALAEALDAIECAPRTEARLRKLIAEIEKEVKI